MNEKESISYALGMQMAHQIKQANFNEINLDAFADAFKAVYNGTETAITNEESGRILQKYYAQQQDQMKEQALFANNKFFDENGKRPEVTTTASGLQYEVLKAADGVRPNASSTVTVHYHGTLLDGTVFDSSVERGEPISFPLANVIKGWQEGVALMPLNSKYRLYIPHDLAYGEQGAGEVIQPFSALIFDVELLAIQ